MPDAPAPFTRIATARVDDVVVRGKSLCRDLIGQVTFTEMTYLAVVEVAPTPGQAAVVDACLVALMEHGLTPSVLAGSSASSAPRRSRVPSPPASSWASGASSSAPVGVPLRCSRRPLPGLRGSTPRATGSPPSTGPPGVRSRASDTRSTGPTTPARLASSRSPTTTASPGGTCPRCARSRARSTQRTAAT